MIRSGQCVLNLPSDDLAGEVNRLARTTGSDPVPEGKQRKGYRKGKRNRASIVSDPAQGGARRRA